MSDPYLGKRTVMRAVLDALLPDGPIWNPIPGGGEDALHAGLSDAWQYVYDQISAWAYVRDPWQTPFLSALEREFGIMPNASLTTAQRQANLAQRKFNRNKTSTLPTLQSALNAAGLGVGGYGLKVFANDPPVNPATFTNYSYVTMLGGTNAYLGYYTGGSAPPYAAFLGTNGALWIVNGLVGSLTPAYWMALGNGNALLGYGVSAPATIQANLGAYNAVNFTPQAVQAPPSGWDCVFFLATSAVYGNGFQFTQQSIPSGNYAGIAWNGTVFCAIAGSGANNISTSPDGITWTARTALHGYTAIAWNGTIFCAIGSTIADTSPDGTTWTARTIPAGNYQAITWNGTIFCAVGTNCCATSPDGTTWTSRTIPSGSYLSVVWNGSLFVASGAGPVTSTSPDGTTWTSRTNSVGCYGLAWTGTQFIGVAPGTIIAKSSDGITWTTGTIPQGDWFAILYISSLSILVTVAIQGLCAVSSDGGNTWTLLPFPQGGNAQSLAWNGSVLCAVGGNGFAASANYITGLISLTTAVVPAVLRQTLVEIVNVWKPLHTWCAAAVNFV